ncbi:MAG: serine/threonine protein kinase [Calditrichaceae bacterium]|nr:serine/threonine protein kinase [Calditrichaceae bacterium]
MKQTNQNLLFEKFRILETIKQDSHRSVYIAEHIFLNKKIFLKTINKRNLPNTVQLDRFKREAQILANLEHPNIIKVWDFGTFKDHFYISFEYFKNQNLREVLNRRQLDEKNKRKLISQLMNGLNYAHNQHIIHRDLKPENILLDEHLNLKIADFGLASIENQAGSTEETTIVGTPAYMSPEQIQGQELTSQSDLFSMGIIIYEIYCGKNPFLGDDTGATLNNILNLNDNLIKYGLAALPEDIKEFVRQLFSKNPDKRPKQIRFPDNEDLTIEYNDERMNSRYRKGYSNRILIAVASFSILILTIYFSYEPIEKMIKRGGRQNEFRLSTTDSLNSSKSEQKNSAIIHEKASGNETIMPLTNTNIPKNINQSEPSFAEERSDNNVLTTGFLMIECLPWADIYIDDIKLESTPLKNPLKISTGVHQVKLVHPEYPHFTKVITVNPNETKYVSVNMDTTIGYLTCRVHPWGEVFIDGKLIGQTPLSDYIRLEAGEHKLIVKNPGFSEFNKSFTINKNDSVLFKINLSKREMIRTADSS